MNRNARCAVQSSSIDLVFCQFSDDNFKKYIPTKYHDQVLQQTILLNLNVSVYVRASECSILYTVLIQADAAFLDNLAIQLRASAKPVFGWVPQSSTVPEFYLPEDKKKVLHKLPIWKMINTTIRSNGPLSTVKLFKHGIQSLYSEKAGVDGPMQARSILRSRTYQMLCEQKLVTQTLIKVVVNSFIVWRMKEKRVLLN